MQELTIAASGVRALLAFCVSKGASERELAARSLIDPVEWQDPDNRIPFVKYVALMRAGQTLCNDPALALHFGETVDMTELSVVGSLGGYETIDDALAQLNRYARLVVEVEGVGSGDRFELCRDRGQLWMVDHRGNPNHFPELTESAFARMVCSSRRFFRDASFFKALQVTHAAPSYHVEYDRVFRMPIAFGCARNALQIDEMLLSRFRLPPTSTYVAAVLKGHAETLLTRLDHAETMRERVEQLLRKLLPAGDVGIDAVAVTLGLSRQTLFRRLREEHVTFAQVLDELRCTLARQYLSGNQLSVRQTAALVGFSDAAAFSRAFKRWTGSSPRSYLAGQPSPAALTDPPRRASV